MPTGEQTPLHTVLERLGRTPTDPAAWSELYRQMWPYVLGLAHYFLGRPADASAAEDVAQDVFYRLARALHAHGLKWPRQDRDLRSLLAVMTRNRCADLLRRHHRRHGDARWQGRVPGDEGLADSGPTPEASVEWQDLIEYLLKRLDPFDQKVLWLLLDGRTPTEIARELGTSARTVHRHYHKIRAVLHQARAEGGRS
jgi:RNA polymerase sigma factor (sigma-70 family)